MADPVVKPANVAGANTGQSGTAPKPASATSQPPSSAPAKGASAPPSAGAKSAPKSAPKPITSIDDLIESAEDRVIPKGSTVRVSPDNADVSTKVRQEELEDSLEACGIKVIWDKTIAKDAIVVGAPQPGARK